MKNVNLELEMLLWQLTEKKIKLKNLKCPYYGLWNSYFDFGSPQQQVDMLARSKKLSFSYNMHLFFLICSTIRSTIRFSKPLLLHDDP